MSEESLAEVLENSTPYLLKRLKGKQSDIKSFLKRIPSLNKNKYSTQSCISKFYDQLPKPLTEVISFKKIDLQEICKLRNDITHANYFYITDEKLYEFTIFIKVLLYLALLKKIGINIEDHWRVVTRIDSFRLLQKPKNGTDIKT